MKRTRLRAKRPTKRRSVHPVQPAHRLQDGSVVKREYRVGVNLRRLAAGKPCYLPLDRCDSQETVVLAHIRRGHVAGIGQKPADVCAIPMCHRHHAMFDGRLRFDLGPSNSGTDVRNYLDAFALQGLCRWLSWLWNNGYLHT